MFSAIEQFSRRVEQTAVTFVQVHLPGLVVIALLGLATFGIAMFNHTLAMDEWRAIGILNFQDARSVQIGRWLQPPIRHILADATPVAAFTVMGLILLQILTAAIIYSLFNMQSRAAFFALAAVSVFHPFWMDTIVFKYTQIPVGVGLVLAATYAVFAMKALNHLLDGHTRHAAINAVVAVVMLVLSAAIYQTNVFLGISIFIMAIIYRMVFTPDIPLTPKSLLMAAGVSITTVVVTLPLYHGSTALSLAISGAAPLPAGAPFSVTGTTVSTAAEFQESLRFTGVLLTQYLFRAQYGFPLFAKLIFLVFVVAYAVVGVRTALSGDEQRNVPLALLLLIVGTAIAFVVPWTLNILRTHYVINYVLTALTPNAFVYAMLIAIVIERVKHPTASTVLMALAGVMVLTFAFHHNAAASANYRVNQRDIAITSRLIHRIETHENYPAIPFDAFREIVMIGRPEAATTLTGKPFRLNSTPGPMNFSYAECGVFNCDASELHFVVSYIAYRADRLWIRSDWQNLPPEIQSELRPIAADMPAYPHPDSVQIIGNRILVTFQPLEDVQ